MYLLITFITITVLLFICGFIKDKLGSWYSDGDIFRVWGFVALFVTVVMIILIPICRYYSAGRVVEYKSRQSTIEQQRKENLSEMERATISREIIDDNAWLNSCRYDINNKWIDIYYDKEILDLEEIK